MTNRRLGTLALVLGLLAPGALEAQATGRLQGTVTETGTGRPLAGVQVVVEGTGVGMITNTQGRYLLMNVPVGTHTVRATQIGYGEVSRQVPIRAGELTTANFDLASEAIALQEIVVTGTVGATQRAKLPIVVDQLRAADMPVPQVSAGAAIQGKVAGATVVNATGRPGSAPSILLRAPTSINASGRNQEPLYIVDGVILSSSMVDFDALDIENVEIVKGAAGASLYGSRAQAGVVQITTKRGSRIADDVVRYSVRTEYGQNKIANTPEALFSRTHQYELQNGQFVNSSNGSLCPNIMECVSTPRLAGQRADGGTVNTWNSFMIEQFPGQTWDQVDRFFRTGTFQQHYISAEGRTGATNFHASYSNLDDSGIMRGQDGFRRHNFRLNLDQAVREDVQLSASAFYSKNTANGLAEGGGSPVFNLTRVPAGANLFACESDVTQECLNNPMQLRLLTDVFAREGSNPLYEVLNRQVVQDRGRFLGSANVRYRPFSWMNVDANVSYDRLDYKDEDFYPKGYRTITANASFNEGRLIRYNSLTEGLNGSLTTTFTRNLGDHITNRTQFRYLFETQDNTWTNAGGSRFAVAEVPTLTNIDQTRLFSSSSQTAVRSDGYFAITNFDMYDRYVFDGLIRNDGSSLFGPDERRQWYYRLAGAWRMAEEPWFTIPAVDEFKWRYSYGTAGGRPSFSAQYETYSVSAGAVLPANLGNRELKPEFTREHEAGFDAAFFGNRLTASLTYADAKTTDQILPVPLPGYVGFGTQWRNAGTLESNTWEASLETRIISRENFNWSARVLFDRTRQEITELNVPAYTYGFDPQGLEQIFYMRPGEALGTFYGTQLVTDCSHLPTGVDCGAFAKNDDGLLVWVGEGGSLSNPQWGTPSTGVSIRGATPMWGEPVVGECTDRISGERTTYCPLGKSLPDYKVSLSSNLNWRGFSVYGLLDSWQGMNIYNQPLQWAIFKGLGGIMDQSGKAEELQKPVGYYDRLYGTSGLATNSFFVEDASFVKLRELSVAYRVGADVLGRLGPLSRFEGMTFSVVGRNLATWTDYRGYDPEAGFGGSTTGSAALARVEGYQYPPFRTWNLAVELNF